VIKRTAFCAVFFASALAYEARAAALSKDDEVARDAAVQWLQLVDADRNDEAASQASAEVRSFEQWQKYFADHRASLGRVNKRQFVEIRRTAIISGVPEVRRYYVVRFRTAFERPASSTSGAASKPVAIENITIAKIGCCWEIFGYTISDRQPKLSGLEVELLRSYGKKASPQQRRLARLNISTLYTCH
jgi:hypothetical protein